MDARDGGEPMTAYLSAFLIANLILSPGWVLLAVVAVVERRGER